MVTISDCVRGIKVGDRIGKRVVLGSLFSAGTENGTTRKKIWSLVTKCDCGRIDAVRLASWKKQKSGGCPDCCGGRKHGDWDQRLYQTWCAMHRRCKSQHHRYGGRGIRVCAEWKSYEPFKAWAMANGYADDLTIDRIDNDGNYEPSNCQWITLLANVMKMHEHYGHKITKRN